MILCNVADLKRRSVRILRKKINCCVKCDMGLQILDCKKKCRFAHTNDMLKSQIIINDKTKVNSDENCTKYPAWA